MHPSCLQVLFLSFAPCPMPRSPCTEQTSPLSVESSCERSTSVAGGSCLCFLALLPVAISLRFFVAGSEGSVVLPSVLDESSSSSSSVPSLHALPDLPSESEPLTTMMPPSGKSDTRLLPSSNLISTLRPLSITSTMTPSSQEEPSSDRAFTLAPAVMLLRCLFLDTAQVHNSSTMTISLSGKFEISEVPSSNLILTWSPLWRTQTMKPPYHSSLSKWTLTRSPVTTFRRCLFSGIVRFHWTTLYSG
mmetsp:Transcript_33453/g.71307  ORF Transcript_33453/g.71307 Transcript_33453/m.71307 type:complete len:247 (-) Transcript_33453:2353-3093(-)